MARVCDICGKGPMVGSKVSHSARKSKRRWMPNLQRVRTLQGNTTKTINACTSCLKAGKVRKAP